MSESFDLEAPDHFTVGTIGPPGQRVFYLQGRESGAIVTLKVEKEQVNALAEYLGTLLARLQGETAPEQAPMDTALLEPVEPVWTVASIGVGYDETSERVVIVAQEFVAGTDDESEENEEASGGENAPEETEDAPEGAEEENQAAADAATSRFHITREQATAFVARARELVSAGRPLCPLCHRPKDQEGHICPRANGHVVPRA